MAKSCSTLQEGDEQQSKYINVFKCAIPGLFFLYFVFPIQLTINECSDENSPMTGFEPWTSGIRSNSSANKATTYECCDA